MVGKKPLLYWQRKYMRLDDRYLNGWLGALQAVAEMLRRLPKEEMLTLLDDEIAERQKLKTERENVSEDSNGN